MTDILKARSLLFTPATHPERYAKALSSGADIVTIDLEDSVAPTDKGRARDLALPWFSGERETGQIRALRINNLQNEHGLRDILAIRANADSKDVPDVVVLPKVEYAAHLEQLDRLLDGPLAAIRLVAMIESARALSNIDLIVRSTPRLVALVFGAADMSADLRSANDWQSLLYARSHVIRAAAEAQLEVLDSPCFELIDDRALRDELDHACKLGFTGKAAIHPKQVALINAAFTPSALEIEEAEKILAENTKGVGVVNGQMVDEAIARRARRILSLAKRY